MREDGSNEKVSDIVIVMRNDMNIGDNIRAIAGQDRPLEFTELKKKNSTILSKEHDARGTEVILYGESDNVYCSKIFTAFPLSRVEKRLTLLSKALQTGLARIP